MRKAPVVLGLLLAVCLTAFFSYTGNYYHANESAIEATTDEGAYANDDVKVESVDGNIAFVPPKAFAGFVFYPGGKVEASAYAPLMQDLAKSGVLCVICPMPFNLAVFDVNAADGVRGEFPDVLDWYIGGHSLGGSMAAVYLDSHPGEFKGLVLLGSYSTADLADDGVKALAIFGSEDGVMNRDNYEANKPNVPGAQEVVLQGGNHAQFGSYGKQSGDGDAEISPDRQWADTAEAIVEWMRS